MNCRREDIDLEDIIMEKKKLVINCADCDARDVKEEILGKYEEITINAANVYTTAESRALLARYNVNINASDVMDIPADERINLQSINGKAEIGPNSSAEEGTILTVNGKLIVLSGAEGVLDKYRKIKINGKLLCPKSANIDMSKFTVNGKIETYPDGVVIMKNNCLVDKLFALRAKKGVYWSNRFVFTDTALDGAALEAKGASFYAAAAVVAESLAESVVPLINEDCDIAVVPDGTAFVSDNITLDTSVVMCRGTRLYINGDLCAYADAAEVLSQLEYLEINGTASVAASLKEAFTKLRVKCDGVKLVGEAPCKEISDKVTVKVDKALLESNPDGVKISDCVTVKIAQDVPPELISQRLQISDCATVVCTEEQTAAVSLIATDVGGIGEKDGKGIFGMIDGIFNQNSDTKMINASNYKL